MNWTLQVARICAAGLVAGLLVAWLAAPARADFTFAQFDEAANGGTEPFAFTFNGPGASFSGTTQGNFTFLIPGLTNNPQAATIALSSMALTPAISAGPILSQPIDGPTNTISFTRLSDGANLLTATFTGNITGLDGDVSATLSGNTASGNTVTYTSDFLDFSGTSSRSLGLDVSNITPGFTQNANGFLDNFVADLTGGFASTPLPRVRSVPEPSSSVLIGIGLSASAFIAVRRKRASRT